LSQSGQTDRQVKYLSRGSGYTLFLTQTEPRLRSTKMIRDRLNVSRSSFDLESIVRMQLKGANSKAKIEGLESLQGKSNYLIATIVRSGIRTSRHLQRCNTQEFIRALM